jgi:transposase-like protein
MNLSQLRKQFGTQKKCIDHLEKLRWGKERACPYCGSMSVKKRLLSTRWHCNSCNKDFSVLVGTIFEDTKLPLPKFFQIMLLMNNSKMGISALEISRNTGIRYETVWYTCMRTRCAMIDNEIRLEGMIEFDEAYFGGKKKNHKLPDNKPQIGGDEITLKRGRGTSKVPVVGAVEKKGRVYLKIIEKLSGKNLLTMLKDKVNTDDSIVITDGFRGYNNFDKTVEHIKINTLTAWDMG